MPDVEDILLDVASKTLGIPKSRLRLDDELGRDIPCDSLQFYNLLIEIEVGFGVEFDPARLQGMNTLRKLCRYLDQHSSN